MCLHRLLLITESGALPENLNVDLTEKIYADSGVHSDTESKDTYPEFRATTHNPVFIRVE